MELQNNQVAYFLFEKQTKFSELYQVSIMYEHTDNTKFLCTVIS